MALIKCNECGGQMSDKAIRCPHCGATNEAPQPDEPMVAQKNPKKKNNLLWIIIAVIVVMAGGCGTWFLLSGNDNAGKDAIVEITPQFTEAVNQYDELYPFSEGLAAVKKDGKYGFINTKGELVIPVQFYGVGGFSEGLALVYDDQYNASFIDHNGNVVIKTKDKLQAYNYIGTSTTVLNPYLDTNVISFQDGVCKMEIKTGSEGAWDNKWIDKSGNMVSEPTEENPIITSEYTVFSKEREDGETFYGLKDSKGNEVIAPAYSYISEPSNGVVCARITEIGYFNNRSEQLDAMERGEDVACSIYGYIDLNGVSTFQDDDYKKIEEFHRIQKNKAYEADRAERQRQREAEIEEYRRQQAQDREWLYGTWDCHVVLNDPYLGRLEQNSKLVISNSNLQVYTDGKLTYNGSYDIENGQIVYDRRNGSSLVFAIDYSNHRLEFGEGHYYTKVSNTNQPSTQNQSYGNGSQNSQRRYRTPQPFHSEQDVKRYLKEHTFKYQNTVAKFGDKSVYLNGYAQTPPPRIVSFNNYNIVVVAGGTTFRIDAQNGTMTDGRTTFVAP